MNTLSWEKAYTVSGLIHVLFFLILALFVAHTAATQPPQMVMVELEGNGDTGSSGGGGGGGGNGSGTTGWQNTAFPQPLSESAVSNSLQAVNRAGSITTAAESAMIPSYQGRISTPDAAPAIPAADTAATTVPATTTSAPAPGNTTGSISSDIDEGTGGGSGSGSGSGDGNGNGDGSGNGSGSGTGGGLGAGFVDNGDGSYTAPDASGIDYQILQDARAVYPDEARSIGYAKTISVTAHILVGLDGSVESVSILSNPPNLGFREAAESALWQMRFSPMTYEGHPVKVPFEKTIYFQP
ncbi:energy transducer TonB [uncultured Megasphaera sp.]|uniref:energy transducer TonB n=1 Tax=uncultured Megasphaera sp. TaxID=165188 RepID=UPI0026181B83|nr:energy transducer TonB [uncultured Megasphaera sp.]